MLTTKRDADGKVARGDQGLSRQAASRTDQQEAASAVGPPPSEPDCVPSYNEATRGTHSAVVAPTESGQAGQTTTSGMTAAAAAAAAGPGGAIGQQSDPQRLFRDPDAQLQAHLFDSTLASRNGPPPPQSASRAATGTQPILLSETYDTPREQQRRALRRFAGAFVYACLLWFALLVLTGGVTELALDEPSQSRGDWFSTSLLLCWSPLATFFRGL
ncbi:unnamed protein product [Parajaminaea phylloscopi]